MTSPGVTLYIENGYPDPLVKYSDPESNFIKTYQILRFIG